jgi:hypothetical protein
LNSALTSISLPDKRPRDAAQLRKKIPMHRGLTPLYFFGVFALFAPFFPIVAMAVNGKIGEIGWGPLIFFFFVAELFAFLFLNQANKTYLKRLNAFVNGEYIKGKVLAQGRNYVFWKSARNYNLTVKFDYKGKSYQHQISGTKASLHNDFPINTEIIGLFDADTESICFPLEIGLTLEIKETARPR